MSKTQNEWMDVEFLGNLESIMFLFYSLSQFWTGYVGDLLNKNKLLVASFCTQATCFGLVGVAEAYEIRARWVYYSTFALAGLAQSVVFPCLVSTVGAWFSKTQRGLATGSWGTCTNMGNILGLQTAALFLTIWHWNVLMYLIAIFLLVNTILVWCFLQPEPQ